jgi:hypothetical protein
MVATPAQRMRAHRARRRVEGTREIRLIVRDARSTTVRDVIAKAVATLDEKHEADVLDWVETVSDFDAPST